MSEVGHSAQRGTGDWPPSSAAPPQLPNEILPSSGQIGGIARDEVVGGLAAFPLPAGQEKHLGRSWHLAPSLHGKYNLNVHQQTNG